MVRRHVSFVPAEDLVEQAIGGDSDTMLGHRPRSRAVLLVADDVGEVLDERAAVSDVQQLGSSADCEHRKSATLGRAEKCDLTIVAFDPRRLG